MQPSRPATQAGVLVARDAALQGVRPGILPATQSFDCVSNGDIGMY
jgi:hypothetical protein